LVIGETDSSSVESGLRYFSIAKS